MTTWLLRLLIVAILGAVGYGAYRVIKELPGKQNEAIATFQVRRGDVVVRSHTRGELRPIRTASLVAPNLFGMVMVNKLAQTGAFADAGNLIAEFDDSELKTRLEEKQLEVEQMDEQLKKLKADLEMRANQDEVELLRARYSVRRAELEVKRNELLSPIDAKRNVLNLEEAKRRLQQLESDVKSRREQAMAELAVLEEKRKKSTMEYGREKDRLKQVRLVAPMNGLVAIKQNRSGNSFFGQQLPDWREGDQVQPGMPVAEILDLSDMEVVAKVNELDRSNLREGQEVKLRLDALPGREFSGKIKNMSATASSDVWAADPVKRFDVTFAMDMRAVMIGLGANEERVDRLLAKTANSTKEFKPTEGSPNAQLPPPPGEGKSLDVLLRPGLLVDVEIILSKQEKVLHVPANAIFEKDGKKIVYLRRDGQFAAQPVEIAGRSESTVILSNGVKEGDVLGLEDPLAPKTKKDNKSTTGPAMPVGGGR
jgi:HlyD family secretion protein